MGNRYYQADDLARLGKEKNEEIALKVTVTKWLACGTSLVTSSVHSFSNRMFVSFEDGCICV